MWRIASIAVFLVLLAGCGAQSVELRAEGTGEALVTVVVNENDPQDQRTVTLPWSETRQVQSGQQIGLVVRQNGSLAQCAIRAGSAVLVSQEGQDRAICGAKAP